MTRPSVITIGNFDGVHRGHRAILATARQLADTCGARVVAMTFDPHPSVTLDPAHQSPRICSTVQKLDRLRRAGADEIEVLEPIAAVLDQHPEEFIARLIRDYAPKAFVEGKDFRFGKDREGDIPKLESLGRAHGFEVRVQPSLDVTLGDLTQVTVRSSMIRWLIGRGRVDDAARCLDEPFSLAGTVVRGEQRGRSIGFPTINLDLNELSDHVLPADGVYAGEAQWDGADRAYPAAISVGNKPSFGTVRLAVEAHLLGFEGDLYGQAVTLSFNRWLRDQTRFPSADALRGQLARDIQRVRTGDAVTLER